MSDGPTQRRRIVRHRVLLAATILTLVGAVSSFFVGPMSGVLGFWSANTLVWTFGLLGINLVLFLGVSRPVMGGLRRSERKALARVDRLSPDGLGTRWVIGPLLLAVPVQLAVLTLWMLTLGPPSRVVPPTAFERVWPFAGITVCWVAAVGVTVELQWRAERVARQLARTTTAKELETSWVGLARLTRHRLRVALELSDWPSARAHAERYLSITGIDSCSAFALYGLQRAALTTGDTALAATIEAHLLSRHPTNPRSYLAGPAHRRAMGSLTDHDVDLARIGNELCHRNLWFRGLIPQADQLLDDIEVHQRKPKVT